MKNLKHVAVQIFEGDELDSFIMSEINMLLASHLQQDRTSGVFQPLYVVSGFVDTTIKNVSPSRPHASTRALV